MFAFEEVIGETAGNHHLLSVGWSPVETRKDWETADGAAKIRWVDEQGQPIEWVQLSEPAKAHWYPDGSSAELRASSAILEDGLIEYLIPGASYRIRLEGNSLYGDLLQARDVLFEVPTDGQVRTIEIPCVLYSRG